MDDLYQEHILDHFRHPRNQGTLTSGPVHGLFHGHGANQGCGDVLDADFVVADGKISVLKWRGTGCAISQAAMSILSDWVVGKTPEEAASLTLQDMLRIIHLPEIASAREKCLILPVQLFTRYLGVL